MKRQLTDEQFDAVMRGIMSDAALDESVINDTADSPATWWGVQRKIAEQKTTRSDAWPPVSALRRWLMVAVPTFAAAALIVGMYAFWPAAIPTGTRSSEKASIEEPADTAVPPTSTNSIPQTVTVETASATAKPRPAAIARHSADRRQQNAEVAKSTKAATSAAKAEVKSEFIALSYARDAESGQIVRVKVPSSMMVTLGLAAAVEKPTTLVDAEVIVGDDGLTRAIRFIR